jgi:hypothetical protein
MTSIQQRVRFIGAMFLMMLCLAPAAKPDTWNVTFIGGNPGDGGTVTTDGCSVCSGSDFTDFDLTILGYEFTPAESTASPSGSPGALFGNDSVNFFNTADFLPLLMLSEDQTWTLLDPIRGVEFGSRGGFSMAPATSLIQETGVPEPSSLILMLSAALMLGFAARRRYQPAAAVLRRFARQ